MTRRVVRERIDPRLTASLFANYRSAVDAVLELVDNAVDSRVAGVPLRVEIGLRPGHLTLTAVGGTGMSAADLERDYLRWGASRKQAGDRIGRYGQGGKAAIGHLGSRFSIVASRRGDDHAVGFEDIDYRDRSRLRTYELDRVPFRAAHCGNRHRPAHCILPTVSVGTAFHPRTASLNRKQQWREWSGYFASSVYADAHDIEYNAIREAAALIDVSPLYKYRVRGPDALRLVDRVITRDATKLTPGRVYYTPWCDEHGKVIDDGTVHALDDGSFRWTAADPQMRWLRLNARGLDVTIDEDSEQVAALALQGPLSRAVLEAATGESFGDLGYFRRRTARLPGIDAPLDVSRTGYTGDLGYELWIPADRAVAAWDAVMDAGRAFGIRPAGMLALDVVRLEAGLILLEVDYTSARHAINPDQNYSPFEIGLGRLVSFDKGDFVGRLALEREQRRGGPARRLVGVELDWYGIERLYTEQGLPPAISPSVDRSPVPVFAPRRGQVGRVTSLGWSPILKQAIGLASVPPSLEAVGSRLDVEWTVEGRRGRVPARVVPLPFLDLERKRA